MANITGISPCVEKLNLSKLKYDCKAEDFFNTLERVTLYLKDLFICNLESSKSFCGETEYSGKWTYGCVFIIYNFMH